MSGRADESSRDQGLAADSAAVLDAFGRELDMLASKFLRGTRALRLKEPVPGEGTMYTLCIVPFVP